MSKLGSIGSGDVAGAPARGYPQASVVAVTLNPAVEVRRGVGPAETWSTG